MAILWRTSLLFISTFFLGVCLAGRGTSADLQNASQKLIVRLPTWEEVSKEKEEEEEEEEEEACKKNEEYREQFLEEEEDKEKEEKNSENTEHIKRPLDHHIGMSPPISRRNNPMPQFPLPRFVLKNAKTPVSSSATKDEKTSGHGGEIQSKLLPMQMVLQGGKKLAKEHYKTTILAMSLMFFSIFKPLFGFRRGPDISSFLSSPRVAFEEVMRHSATSTHLGVIAGFVLVPMSIFFASVGIGAIFFGFFGILNVIDSVKKWWKETPNIKKMSSIKNYIKTAANNVVSSITTFFSTKPKEKIEEKV